MSKSNCMQASVGICRKGVWAAVLPLFLATGCQTATETGGLVGGLFGAGVGNVIGAATHNRAAGTLIGGAAGAATGLAVGSAVDDAKEKKAVQQAVAVQTEAQKRWPSLMDIQQLSASGTSDAIIINQIRTTGAIYNLRPEDIQWLQQNGVHDGVIAEMQATATRAQPPVVYRAPPPAGVVVVEEPPPYVRFGYGYGYRRGW